MMGLVLLAMMLARRDVTRARPPDGAWSSRRIGVLWYLICMRLVIPHFNRGQQPFYIDYFYGNYGSSTTEIVARDAEASRSGRVRRHPARPDALLP